MLKVRNAQEADRDQLARMRLLLWPDHTPEEHLEEIDSLMSTGKSGTLPGVILVSEDDGALTGFLEVGLRSHADGCDTARPVGFVEGWFVLAASRGRGIGRELMRAAEVWARVQGCLELASDTPVDNHASQRAHEALGFEVADRCVHFRKAI
jgi:aminoglycoside 6'-N-acetyltransferase I